MPNKKAHHPASATERARDLDIEIGFLEGVLRRDPQYIDALQLLGDDYTKRGRLSDGLRIDQQLTQLRPEDPLAHYNLACSYALTEQWQQAVETLHRALDTGYRDFAWLRRDPDLKNLRRHPLYRTVRARVRLLCDPGQNSGEELL